jgi:hypothetical protein
MRPQLVEFREQRDVRIALLCEFRHRLLDQFKLLSVFLVRPVPVALLDHGDSPLFQKVNADHLEPGTGRKAKLTGGCKLSPPVGSTSLRPLVSR